MARTLRPDRSVGSLATSTGFDLYELLARLCGNWFSGVAKGFNVELDRFSDIGHSFTARVALAVTPGRAGTLTEKPPSSSCSKTTV
jgi:hypothetical protein